MGKKPFKWTPPEDAVMAVSKDESVWTPPEDAVLADEPVKKKDDTVIEAGSTNNTSIPGYNESQEPSPPEAKPSGDLIPQEAKAAKSIFTGLYDLGRKAISTLKDEMVGAFYTEKAIQKKTDFIDELVRTQPEKYGVANEYASPEARRAYAEKQADKEFPGWRDGGDVITKEGKVVKVGESYKKAATTEKLGYLAESAKQKEEGAKYTEGIPKTWDEAVTKGQVPSYIGAAMGNGLAQIPASVATLGTSSYFMEKTGAYDEALNAIAKESGMTPEQVVSEGMDQPAKDIAHMVGLVNGAIDLGSSAFTVGKGVAQGVKSLIKKKATEELLKEVPEALWKKGVKAASAPLIEYGTEFQQGVNSQVGSFLATGKKLEDINWDKDINWSQAREEGLQGLFGSMGIVAAGHLTPSQVASEQHIQVKDSGDLGKATEVADKIQASVDNTSNEKITNAGLSDTTESTVPPGNAGQGTETITQNQPTEGVQNDNQNQQRLPGQERVGQEPVQTKPEQSGGRETPGGSGVLQAQQGEEVNRRAEDVEYTDEEIQRQFRPIADKMADVEREFKNEGYEIDMHYDGETLVLDKKGEIVEPEDLPDNLKTLAGQYEEATSKLAGLDETNFRKVLDQARKEFTGEETKFEEVKPKELAPQTETVYHGGNLDSDGEFLYVTPDKKQAEAYAKGNDSKITHPFTIDKSKLASEKQARKVIADLGLKSREKKGWNTDELKFHELFDSHFDTSLSEEDIQKVKKELQKQGYNGISFSDEDITGMKRLGVNNYVLFDRPEGFEKAKSQPGNVTSTIVKDAAKKAGITTDELSAKAKELTGEDDLNLMEESDLRKIYNSIQEGQDKPADKGKAIPKEVHDIARAYHEEARNPTVEAHERAIADEIGKVSQKSVKRFGDKNKVGSSMAKSYLSKDGETIDQVAQRASYGLNPNGDGNEVSPDQVWEFMQKYPNGPHTMSTPAANPKLAQLNEEYKKLTGKGINQKIAKDIADSVQNYVGDKDANTELNALFDKNGNLDDTKLIAELEADREEFQKKYGLSDEELDLAARDLYESQEQRKQSGGETSRGDQPSAVEGPGEQATTEGASQVEPPQAPPVIPTESKTEEQGPGAKKYAILNRIEKSNVNPAIKRGVKERGDTYIPKGLDITNSEADALIELYGDKADGIVRDITNGITPDARVALTAKLYQSYVDRGMNDQAVDIAMWQAEQSLQAGRAGNAAKIWKMITQSGEDNIVLAIEKEQGRQVSSVVEPVREELNKSREEIEAEIRRLVEKGIQEGVKERVERTKLISKEKKKQISDAFDKLKGKVPPGMMMASPGPIIIQAWNGAVEVAKQAVLTGASIANAVQAAIDHFRSQVGDHKFDEKVFRDNIGAEVEKLIPVDASKVNQDEITVPKLTGRKKKEFIDEVLKAYNDGKLTDKKFDELYAKKLGVQELSTEDRDKIRGLAKTIADAEKFDEELKKDFTPENIKKHKEFMELAKRANQQLQEFATAPNNIWDTFISIMQGNLLSSMSLVSNIWYNSMFQPLRFTSTGLASMIDYGLSKAAKMGIFGKSLEDRTIDIVAMQRGYFKGGWNGSMEGLKQLKSGSLVDERNLREIQQGFNPGRAMERWDNADRTLAQKANDYVEGTIGWEAEVMFRLLNLGDKPWKRAAELARAHELGSLKGLKGEELQKFILLPDEASQEEITKAGQEATFQQTDKSGKGLQNAVSSALNFVAKIPIVGGPAKVILKSQLPYIKTPYNLIAETMAFAAPPVTLGVGIYKIATGNKRQGSILIGKAIVGAMIQKVAYELFLRGLMTGDDDKEKKKREFQQGNTPPPNSFNISALNRALSGDLSLETKDDDTWVSYAKMGTTGVLFDNYANTYKERIADTGSMKGDNGAYFVDMLTSGPRVASSTLDQTFLQGMSTFLEAIRGGSERGQETWLIKTSEALASIAYPNTISTISKATDQFNRDTEDPTFWGRMANTYKTKVFAGNTLPPKVSLWGDRITGNPEGRSKFMFYMFDPSKFRNVDTDDYRYKLYENYKADYDGDWLPSMPQKSLKVDGQERKLTSAEYEIFATDVGKLRANLTSGYINSAAWDKASKEQKKENLKYLYGLGLDYGKREFLMDTGLNMKKDYSAPIDVKVLQHNLSKMRQKLK